MSENRQWLTAEERANRTYARSCGECNLCCKLLPVKGLHESNKWCQHAVKGKGCAIYADRPGACRAWACMWLSESETSDRWGLRRPDKCHFVIDEGADVIGINGEQVATMQVWVDPGYPTAWRADPGLKRLIEDFAKQGVATMLRYGDIRGRVVLAPPLGNWEERESEYRREETTLAEKAAFFGGPLDEAARKSLARSEHIEWARKRALEYLDQDQPNQALSSFVSDMTKHEGTALSPHDQGQLMHWLINGDLTAIRRFIMEAH